MKLLVVLLTLLAMISIRIGFLAYGLRNPESLWYDLERRRIKFHVARVIDILTLLAFIATAVYAMWNLTTDSLTWTVRYGIVFVSWLGIGILGKLPVCKFPRTNTPRLYSEAQISLIVNLAMSFLAAIAMTIATAVWFWIRG